MTRVLLVDDREVLRDGLKRIFDQNGLPATFGTLPQDLLITHRRFVITGGMPTQRAALHEKLAGMIPLIDATFTSIRWSASKLRPSLLAERDLIQARMAGESVELQTGIGCTLYGSLKDVALTDEQIHGRIAHSAGSAHQRSPSCATAVQITITEDAARTFSVTIGDNGRYITEDDKARSCGLGLLGMQERADLIGGELTIPSGVGKVNRDSVTRAAHHQ